MAANLKCNLCDKEVLVGKVSLARSEDGTYQPSPPIMCECGGKFLQLDVDGIPDIANFASLPPSEKRRRLTERAREHDKTLRDEIKFRNDNMTNTIKRNAGIE